MRQAQVASLVSHATKERLVVDRVPTIPVGEKVTRTTVSMPDELWEQMREAARTISEESKKEGRRPFSRDDVIAHACRWWLQEWYAERAKKKAR